MMCSRACVRTCTVTSSGMRPLSISVRRKTYSVSLAAGKPTSISLKPTRSNSLKNSTFCSSVIGSMSAWLPSRRSTLHHTGARSTLSFSAQSIQRTGGRKYCFVYLSKFFMTVSFRLVFGIKKALSSSPKRRKQVSRYHSFSRAFAHALVRYLPCGAYPAPVTEGFRPASTRFPFRAGRSAASSPVRIGRLAPNGGSLMPALRNTVPLHCVLLFHLL